LGVVVGSYVGDRYVSGLFCPFIVGGANPFPGGSAIMAVEVLKSKGVPEDRILFLNVLASPQGINAFATRFPNVRVVTAFVDEGLDEKR
jgi:uracil phosphoribosyltransferase